MNERIDDIAFRAGCLRNSYSDPKHPDLDGFIVNYETLDKFAELIVEECCKSFQGYTFEEIAVKTLKATFRN